MSRSAEVILSFAGEDRAFRLPISRLRALQEKTDCGPRELCNRFEAGTWRIDDVRETILQGLIGGGMNVDEASKIMKNYFDDLPYEQFVILALAIVLAALVGPGDEPPGE